jgi:hypothetical protein
VETKGAVADQGGKMQEKETLDERLPGLFEPDTLLPIQYFEAMRRKHLLEGEKRLVLSVLEDAIECFMKCIDSQTSKGQRLFREADEWINYEDKRWVFSFDNVCDMLDIDPDYMRRGLRRWKEQKLAAAQAAVRAPAVENDVAEQPRTTETAETAPKESHAAPTAAAPTASHNGHEKRIVTSNNRKSVAARVAPRRRALRKVGARA